MFYFIFWSQFNLFLCIQQNGIIINSNYIYIHTKKISLFYFILLAYSCELKKIELIIKQQCHFSFIIYLRVIIFNSIEILFYFLEMFTVVPNIITNGNSNITNSNTTSNGYTNSIGTSNLNGNSKFIFDYALFSA